MQKNILLLALLCIPFSTLHAMQARELTGRALKRHVKFMDDHWRHLLASAKEGLKANPAQIIPAGLSVSVGRKQSLLLMDAVLHDLQAPSMTGVQEILTEGTIAIAEALKGPPPEKGVVIWKLYNMGFIIHSKEATIAFDIVKASYLEGDGFSAPVEAMHSIIASCDALFVSHLHNDHADNWVVQNFLEQEKPVIAPSQYAQTKEWYSGITHLKRDQHIEQTVALKNKKNLTVTIYPGHQGGAIENNVSFVTLPNGITVGHTGDQYNKEDMQWISTVGKDRSVDVLLLNSWAYDHKQTIAGINPKLLISGHEVEMGHLPYKREPFWRSLTKLQAGSSPSALLMWGESILYRP